MKKLLILITAVIMMLISVAVMSASNAEGSNVYITIGKQKYYSSGTKIMNGNKVVVDLASVRRDKIGLDEQMAKTIFVTDLAHKNFNGNDVIFIAALGFKNNKVDFDDTSSYKNMKVNVGAPYLLLLSCNLGEMNFYPYKEENSRLSVEGFLKLQDIWMVPYKSEFNEDMGRWNKQGDSFTFLYDYANYAVHPRIIMSKYHNHLAYVLFGDQEDINVNHMGRHIKVSSMNISRKPPDDNFSREMFYVTFDFFNQIGRDNRITYKVNPANFFMWESGKNKLVVANEGTVNSVAIEADISTYGRPKLLQTYWRKK